MFLISKGKGSFGIYNLGSISDNKFLNSSSGIYLPIEFNFSSNSCKKFGFWAWFELKLVFVVNPISFKVYFSNEFAAEALENGYKYGVVFDNATHSKYRELKTLTSLTSSYFDNLINKSFPTQSPYESELLDIGGGNIFAGVLVKKVKEGDNNNLTKRITLIDASTFFNIKTFTCSVTKETVTNNSRAVTEGDIVVEIEGQDPQTIHVTTRGTAYVEGSIYKIIFAGHNLNIESVQCELFRSASSSIGTVVAEYKLPLTKLAGSELELAIEILL